MSDVAITWNKSAMEGIISFDSVTNDLKTDDGLYTAVLISLFTDARANEDDVLPGVLLSEDFPDRRGWWGDETSERANDSVGSRLWLLERAKKTEENLRKTETYVREALQWMLDEDIASKINVKAEMGSLNFSVDILRKDGNSVSFKFQDVWEGSRYDREPADIPTSLFCAVNSMSGADTCVYTSLNSDVWKKRKNPVMENLKDIVWSKELGLFVAVGGCYSVGSCVITSLDGKRWAEHTLPTSKGADGVCWSPELSLFCAVGESDTGAYAFIATSPDGKDWTAQTNPQTKRLRSVCWSPGLGLFCAVGDNMGYSYPYIVTSPDGETWTQRIPPNHDGDLYSVTWSEDVGKFVAVGTAPYSHDYACLLVSSNGTTWVQKNVPTWEKPLYGVCWSPELSLFCAVGGVQGSNTYIVTSPTGSVWSESNIPIHTSFADVIWCPELSLFCAVGLRNIIISFNGIDWVVKYGSLTYPYSSLYLKAAAYKP